MSALETPTCFPGLERTGRPVLRSPEGPAPPILAAVDGSSASTAAVETAARLGADLGAPVLFVYVRRGPAGFLGAPLYQRRLTAAMARARGVLGRALLAEARRGVAAEGEILEGSPRRGSSSSRQTAARAWCPGALGDGWAEPLRRRCSRWGTTRRRRAEGRAESRC